MEIRNRFTKEIIYKSKHKTIKKTVADAIFEKADLSGANLSGAILCNTKFHKTKIPYRGKIVEVNFTEVS